MRAVTSALNRWLALVAALLLVVALAGGVVVWRTKGERADAAAQQERYGAVLSAADAEATAFVNLRYDRAQRTVRAVARGATGGFRRHYDAASGRVVRVLRRQHSVMEGRVLWSGVVAVGPQRATVLVATTGTVSNRGSHGKPVRRDYRLRLSLVLRDGRWLTTDVRFAGAGS